MNWIDGDASYCALVPYYEEKEQMLEDDGEFVVLKREMIDGEERCLHH